jgi:hypothetical protein
MAAASAPTGSPSSVLGVTHPLYQRWRPIWVRQLDVFEGSGGFLDESRPYLIPHPREWLDHSLAITAEDGVTVTGYTVNPSPSQPSPKLIERRRLARYENVAATLIEQLAGALFREKPNRAFKEDAPAPKEGMLRPIEQFWADADGQGNSWDDLLAETWKPCAAFGHLWGYVDVMEGEDGKPKPVVRYYTPIDVPDWLTDDYGQLVSVKFLEAAPREAYDKLPATQAQQVLVREVTAEGWTLKKRNGHVVDEGTFDYGVIPVFIQYAKRRALTPYIGRSVLGDPQLYIDLYNCISEVRELLRKQTFSIINIPVGDSPGGVEMAMQMMGRQSGTGNALFTPEPAKMLSADSDNVSAYHEHMDRLTRLIYRLSVVAWESDSRDAESAESRTIKRDDLNQVLAGYSDECKRVDEFVTDMVYRITYGEAWENWRKKDGLTLRWPDTFDAPTVDETTKQFSDAIALDLGETATKEIRKRAARAVLPDLSETTLKDIDAEIDAMEVKSQEEIRQEEMKASVAKVAGAFGG